MIVCLLFGTEYKKCEEQFDLYLVIPGTQSYLNKINRRKTPMI